MGKAAALVRARAATAERAARPAAGVRERQAPRRHRHLEPTPTEPAPREHPRARPTLESRAHLPGETCGGLGFVRSLASTSDSIADLAVDEVLTRSIQNASTLARREVGIRNAARIVVDALHDGRIERRAAMLHVPDGLLAIDLVLPQALRRRNGHERDESQERPTPTEGSRRTNAGTSMVVTHASCAQARFEPTRCRRIERVRGWNQLKSGVGPDERCADGFTL